MSNKPVAPTMVERPVKARLVVRADATNEEWDATEEDLQKFGYRPHLQAEWAWTDFVIEALESEGIKVESITDTKINALRYIFELASTVPEVLVNPGEDLSEYKREIAAIERTLREHLPEEPVP